MPKLDNLLPPAIYLGIDPGDSGGLVILSRSREVIASLKMPDSEVDLWQFLGTWGTSNIIAVCEQVQGYIGEGRPGGGMFKFGQNYGAIRMGLVAAGISFTTITPRPWQKALGIAPKPKDMKKEDWKRKLKALAQERFPRVTVTAWMADALLISDYCRRRELGLLK